MSVSYPNSKADHLAGMARMVCDRFDGRIPETMEDMVIYKDDSHIWIRPLAMFEEEIEVDNKKIKRFERIG